jgi:hypothetical protein
MSITSNIRRVAVVAGALAALTTSVATAREADQPIVRSDPATTVSKAQDLRSPDVVGATQIQRRSTPARTEGMGVQPVPAAVASQPDAVEPAPAASAAAPLATSDDSGGMDWLAFAIGGFAVLAVGLAGGALWSRHAHAVGTS